MTKILIVYYSRSGNTEKMAEEVKEGAVNADAEVNLKKAEDASPKDMLDADGIIIGSPTYYGLPSAEIKELFDSSVKYHGKLEGRAAGAFSSSANIGGGNETTVLAIIEALLIHGMVVPGSSSGGHYGPVSIGAPGEKALKECRMLGKRVAELAEKIRN